MGQEADWIEGLSPEEFQRLALDLLRNHVEGVRPIDLPHGRTDGGFDGELIGRFGELSGRVRVSVKGNGTFERLKAAAVEDAKTHSEQPMLLISRLRLDASQQAKLKDAIKEATEVKADVIDGGLLASWLRDLHHLRASWWGEDASLTPMSLRLAPLPEGRRSRGPWLRTECVALGALVQAVQEGKRLVLLATPPHTRGERCLWGLGRRLDRHPSGRVVWWLKAGRAPPGYLGPKQREAVFLAAPSNSEEEELLDWAEGQWQRGHPSTLVLAVADFRLDEVQALHRGDPSEVGVVRLSRPADYGEVERLTRWLFDRAQVSDVTRRNFAYTWSHLPSLMEQGARRPELGVGRYIKDFDPAARTLLGLFALIADRPGDPTLEQWAEGVSGLAPIERGSILTQAQRSGWLEGKVPSSPGQQWLMIHAWLAEDRTAIDRLVRSEIPDEALLRLAWAGRAEDIEGYLLGRLRTDGLMGLLPLLARMPLSTERLTRAVIEVARDSLDALTEADARHLAAALLKATLWPALVPAAMTLALRLRERGVREHRSPQPPGTILASFTNPSRGTPTLTALAGLRWVRDRLDDLDPRIALDCTAPWLRGAVEHTESGPDIMSVGAAPWRTENPQVVECWTLAAEILAVLLVRRPFVEEAWKALRPIGTSPVDPQRAPPQPQAKILRQLFHEAIQSLPTISDPYERGLADSTLLVHIGRDTSEAFVDDALARAILEGLSRDPRVAAAMAGVAIPRPIIDPEALLQAYPVGGHKAVAQSYKSSAWDHKRLAQRLVDAEVNSEDLLDLLRALDRRIGSDSGPLMGFRLFQEWARLAPSVFEPVVLGERWKEVPRDMQRPLLAEVAPVFGARLLGRPTPETPSPRRMGAALRLVRLLDQPDRVEADEAITLLPALEALLEPAEVMGVLFRLAERAEPALRVHLILWLYRYMGNHPVDARDLAALLPRLLVQPVSVEVLHALMLVQTRPEAQHGELILDAAVRALEQRMDSRLPEGWFHAPQFERLPLLALCRALMSRSPTHGLFILSQLDTRVRFQALSELAPETLQSLLRACPDPLDTSNQLVVVQALAERIPLDRLEELIRQSSPERARVLLIAADAPVRLARLVAEAGEGIQSSSEREMWIRKLLFGSLLPFRSTGRPMLVAVRPEEPPTDTNAAQSASTLRAIAKELPPGQAAVLRLLAAQFDS